LSFTLAFLGCGYAADVMAEMAFPVGSACNTYIRRVTRKRLQDKKRKVTKKFKRQRKSFFEPGGRKESRTRERKG